MDIKQLEMMGEQIANCTQGQLGDLKNVNAKQLGEAIDMIKDLAEAVYYCTITDSMKKSEQQSERKYYPTNISYYTTPATYGTYYDPWRQTEREKGYMYYPGEMSSPGGEIGTKATMHYSEPYMREMTRDPKQGRAYMRRRTYMEGKEKHNDTNSQLRELEAYLQELSSDITEMVKDASQEERNAIRQKMTTLASKIV